MIINEGGSGVHISYDSETTTEGARDLLKKLNSFRASNERVRDKFKDVLGELEGEAIKNYEESVNEYTLASMTAEAYLDIFLRMIELTDTSIEAAEVKSKAMFDDIEV
ncbi:hypothetical protein V1498_20720 [Peribacillus sp. SCS-26]|uniref:hypothetical protein n=1 Tax=Paraperibacillus marinus TaxID=3115295 RepID=UPI00390689B5